MKKEQQAPSGIANGVTDQDAVSITALFDESRPALVRYLQSRLRGSAEEAKEEAMELAQDAYLRLLRMRKRRNVTHWKELLWCTARNLANNRVERHKARKAAEERMQLQTHEERTPESSCIKERTDNAIERARNKLPQRQQEVIARVGRGESYKQIAYALGVNERTCRRDFEEAILQIRQQAGLGPDA